MNHDPPHLRNLNYNTSTHLLNYLESIENRKEDIFIALCFKIETNFICQENDKRFKNWKSLIDEFYERANKISSKVSFHLEFILDGAGKPENCLKDKWRPWKSGKFSFFYIQFITFLLVWISTPIGAFLSNHEPSGYDRFQLLNPSEGHENPSENLEILQKFDYGKFLKSKYTFLLWEPQDQVMQLVYFLNF